MKNILSLCIQLVGGLLIVVGGVVTLINWVMVHETEPLMVTIRTAHSAPVALVFGAGLRQNGTKPSPLLQDRLVTAKELYHAGIVKKIILSGDNSTLDYNEPAAMKAFLVDSGVPDTDLILDYAGLRTYDSCVRLKKVFQQDDAIVVTQRFHLPRALYTCSHVGVTVQGVAADRAQYRGALTIEFREVLARVLAWADVTVLKPDPKYLGEVEKVF